MIETSSGGSILEFSGAGKKFKSGTSWISALAEVSFAVKEAEKIAIVGPSGSGKSTLLSLAAGLEVADEGTVTFCGTNLAHLSEDDRARMRNMTIGFVYQNFQLLPTLTAIENVTLPLELREGVPYREALDRAADMLGRIGLKDRLQHYPSQLSGGEQQRVALARAFVASPRLLLADEPTGSLDRANADIALQLLHDLNDRAASALVIVTHDPAVAESMQRRITLHDGRVV